MEVTRQSPPTPGGSAGLFGPRDRIWVIPPGDGPPKELVPTAEAFGDFHKELRAAGLDVELINDIVRFAAESHFRSGNPLMLGKKVES